MKYAILKIVNDVFSIDSEWSDNLNGAKVKYHDVCKNLWNATDVQTATVELIDVQGNLVPGYKEYINHVEPEQV